MTPPPPCSDDDAVLMVSELTHRFVNGLQIIDGCLARLPASRDALAEIEAIRGRLGALARLNRLLAAGDWYGDACAEQLDDLCTELKHAFGRPDVQVKVTARVSGLEARDEQRLALLVLELVTNVLKHRPGAQAVKVDLVAEPHGCFDLRVTDDGGAPARWAGVPKMATALALALGGRLQVMAEGGVAVRAVAAQPVPTRVAAR